MRKQTLHPRTAVINQKQKNLSKKSRLDALVWLSTSFPEAFDNSKCIRPLSLGIMDEILTHADEAAKAGISKSKLREAVVLFARRLDYLACLKAREMRVDLQGNPTVAVTEEDAERATLKIKKRIEKSIKAARKANTSSNASPSVQRKPSASSSSQDFMPYYSADRESGFGARGNAVQTVKTPPSITVKHKPSRQYNSDAVARLKEKLGLVPQKSEEA